MQQEVIKDLVAACKYTLIGKFSNTMPKVDLIRKNFILQKQLSGGVKIAYFNSRHVYIDLDNELDYNMVWTKQRMSIAGQVMRIQAWTPNFKPAKETPLVPIWISLPELPWHYYNKEFFTSLLSPIGKVLYLDSVSIKKTRGSQTRVKVQVGLSQERPPHVRMGYIGEDITDGSSEELDLHTGNKADRKVQLEPTTSGKGKNNIPQSIKFPVPRNKIGHVQRKKATKFTSQAVKGIDSMLPAPEPLDNVVNVVENVIEEAVGGTDGRVQEIPTNLHEGVPKGRGELTHVMHEDVVDHSSDYRAPATPISSHKNIGQKRDINTDEMDSNNQSIEEFGEEEKDNNNQPPQNFDSTFKDKWPEEVQDITAK
ncbi:hypothetical protein H5410_027624 [Solanum commersonii]|uniref:DUF4283 domain-containing protein n=1 Tax=Solanum commersonii TaxID=4109 RepID=A0A9J5Z3W8_SOLCO|nr:hypothetical protein H5410_027624 [Solanum commersonii]